MNPKAKKPEGICTKKHNSQTLKIKGKEKKLKTVRENVLHIGENNSNNSGFLFRNHRGQKKWAHHFSSAKRKVLSSQNSISSEIILQE